MIDWLDLKPGLMIDCSDLDAWINPPPEESESEEEEEENLGQSSLFTNPTPPPHRHAYMQHKGSQLLIMK